MINPTPAAADTALAPARNRLADAITALIDAKRVYLDNGRHTWIDSVYQQLADAVYQKHALGQGRAQPASPLWIDASDCLRDIDHAARIEHPKHPGFTSEDRSQAAVITHPTVLRLQQIDKRLWRPQDTNHIQRLAADLERLTQRAEQLLNPTTRRYLPNPCPLCSETHVYVPDSGDQVRRPALQVTIEYCRCQNIKCDGYWPADKFQFLGHLLGYDTPEGVIT